MNTPVTSLDRSLRRGCRRRRRAVVAGLAMSITAAVGVRGFGAELPAMPQLPRGPYHAVPADDLDSVVAAAGPVFVGDWDRAAAGSAVVKVGWGPEVGLLIVANVYDDSIDPAGAGARPWSGDCVEVYLDLRPEGQRDVDLDLGDTQGLAGQLIVVPPADDDDGDARPRVHAGGGDLSQAVKVDELDAGYRRTDTGYQVWLTIPPGAWLAPGQTILADFALNDAGGDATGQHFAFGESFNWKSNARYARLTLAEQPGLPVAMSWRSRMGIAGQAGSNDVYEHLACVMISEIDPARLSFALNPAEALPDAHHESDAIELGAVTLYRDVIRGRRVGQGAVTATVSDGERERASQWPGLSSAYRALLEAIDEQAQGVAPEHMGQMMYEVAREDVLAAMRWRTPTGPELVQRVRDDLDMAKSFEAGDGPSRIRGYYSTGQQRWVPFGIISGGGDASQPTGIDIRLHGSSGEAFTRGAFIRRILPESDEPTADDHDRPARTGVFFYGGGNDYWGVGMDDWRYIPAYLRTHLNIDSSDVHLRGHSMGGGATYLFGARVPGLGPGLPFRSFTPAAASVRDRDAPDGGSYESFVARRRGVRSLAGNLITRPWLLVHGVDDIVIRVDRSRQALVWLREAGAHADLLEIPGQGHGPTGYEALRNHWLAGVSDQPITSWTAYEPRFAQAHGVRAEAFEVWGQPATLRFPEPGAIETDNVAVLDLSQWGGDWPVTVNGERVTEQDPRWVSAPSFADAPDATRRFKTVHNTGPIIEVARRGFVIVTGTQVESRRNLLEDVSRRVRDTLLQSEWGLKEDMLKIYRDDEPIPSAPWIIVVGTPAENAYAARRAADDEPIVAGLGGLAEAPRSGLLALRPGGHMLIRGDASLTRGDMGCNVNH